MCVVNSKTLKKIGSTVQKVYAPLNTRELASGILAFFGAFDVRDIKNVLPHMGATANFDGILYSQSIKDRKSSNQIDAIIHKLSWHMVPT